MLGNMKQQNFAAAYFEGLVVNNNDPKKGRRIQFRIKGMHDDVPDENLPWARCLMQSDRGATATVGSVYVPVVGASVVIRFQNGDPQYPVYSGSVISTVNVPPLFQENYPERSGWILGNATHFYVDETTNVLHAHHRGTTVTIEENGKVVISVADASDITVTAESTIQIGKGSTVSIAEDSNITVGGDSTLNVSGSATIVAGSDVSVQAGGSATVHANSSATLEAGGAVSVKAGGSATVQASGVLTLKGSAIRMTR